jgi:hypothetical protein
VKRGIGVFLTGFFVIILYFVLGVIGILPAHSLVPNVFVSFIIFVLVCSTILSLMVLQFGVFSRAISRSRIFKRYSEPNPRLFRRAIRDGVDGVEKLVVGSETTTFREACLDQWQFSSVDRKSNWLIKDERGNDATDYPLSRFDGVLIIQGEYQTDAPLDKSDEYSSIHDSVEYYD